MHPDQPTRPKVFISHTSADHEFVEKLGADLERDGCQVWTDEAKLHIGDSIPDEIQTAIGEAHFVIAVLSKASVKRPWIQEELREAIERQIREKKKRFILACVIEDCNLPGYLKARKYADFATNPYSEAYQGLLNAIVAEARRPRDGASQPIPLQSQDARAPGPAAQGTAKLRHPPDVSLPQPSCLARETARTILRWEAHGDGINARLSLLSESDRAAVIDLVSPHVCDDDSSTRRLALSFISQVAGDAQLLRRDRVGVLMTQATRRVVLSGSLDVKADALSCLESELLATSEEHVLHMLFVDVISLIDSCQFDAMNKLTGGLVAAAAAMPRSLWPQYVRLLVKTADSQAYRAAPIADRAIGTLGCAIASAGLESIFGDPDYVATHIISKSLRKLVARHGEASPERVQEVVTDFAELPGPDFMKKHGNPGT